MCALPMKQCALDLRHRESRICRWIALLQPVKKQVHKPFIQAMDSYPRTKSLLDELKKKALSSLAPSINRLLRWGIRSLLRSWL